MNILLARLIQSLFIVSFEGVLTRIFFEIFLPQKPIKKILKYLYLPFYIFLFLIVPISWVSNIVLKFVYIVSAFSLIAIIYFRGKYTYLIFLSMVFGGLFLSLDYVLLVAIKLILPLRYESLLYDPVMSTILALLCKSILFIVILLIKKIWDKNNELSILTKKQWGYLFLFSLLTTLILLSIFLQFGYAAQEDNKNTILFISICTVVLNLTIFYLIKDIIHKETAIRTAKISVERVKNQMNMYYNALEHYKEQRKRAHDYKNQIGCIQELLLEGETSKALEYISSIVGEINIESNIIKTNNIVLDAIINQKYKYAYSKGINFTLSLNDLSGIKIAEKDLVVIFSNILDNAIEACDKLEDNKLVTFKCLKERGQIVIIVKNPVSSPVTIENNVVATSKKNKGDHGIGILNITNTVKKYGGSYKITCQNNIFCFSAIIPS